MKLNRIRLVLVEKGISQTQLAKDLGKSFCSVNAYCCNYNRESKILTTGRVGTLGVINTIL